MNTCGLPREEAFVYVERAARALERVRAESPLVMCLTNTVVANWTANCLLAAGATPAMMEEASEAVELAGMAKAVLVNVGTLTEPQAQVMRAAVAECGARNVPWVLDPVAADLLTFRRGVVRELLAAGPRMVRGNARELAGLNVRGVVSLATAAVDEICSADGERVIRLANGHPMLQRVTGTGCAQGALAAAMCAVEPDAMVAAVGTSLWMALAGEMAAAKASRPGAFQMALLDALDAVTPDDFVTKAKLV